ncbi:MAG: TlpA family protein disulfide reductase, partial [Flavobacteriales bacterium]
NKNSKLVRNFMQDRKMLQKLQKQKTQVTKRFIENHSNSPASLTALSILRKPAAHVNTYQKVYKNLKDKLGHSQHMNFLEAKIDKFKKKRAEKRKNKKLRKMARNKIKVGKKAPDIKMKTPSGDELALSSIKDKVVLIDFWASWCGPCRKANPHVVKLYNKYKDKGFEIFGVSLDKNKRKWVQAIKQDGLKWKHVSDLKGWQSKAAAKYGVSSIPYTVLIDKEGKIIAKKLRGKDLEKKLEEIFG